MDQQQTSVSSSDIPKLRNQKGQNLSEDFKEIALEACRVARAKLTGKEAQDIAFNQLMTGAGIAVDKMQLLNGQPTTIIENLERTDISLVIEAILAEIDR